MKTPQPPQLKDVICKWCDRTIGQRTARIFTFLGLEISFSHTAKVRCPFCKKSNEFKVNSRELAEARGV